MEIRTYLNDEEKKFVVKRARELMISESEYLKRLIFHHFVSVDNYKKAKLKIEDRRVAKIYVTDSEKRAIAGEAVANNESVSEYIWKKVYDEMNIYCSAENKIFMRDERINNATQSLVIRFNNFKRSKKKYYPDIEDKVNLIEYIFNDKKTHGLIGTSGLAQAPEAAAKQITGFQKDMKGTRSMYHFIVSFPKELKDVEIVNSCGKRIVDYIGSNYPALYGVHQDKQNLHVHFAFSALGYNNKKLHISREAKFKFYSQIAAQVNMALEQFGYTALKLKFK